MSSDVFILACHVINQKQQNPVYLKAGLDRIICAGFERRDCEFCEVYLNIQILLFFSSLEHNKITPNIY